jgi:hypothetical protein
MFQSFHVLCSLDDNFIGSIESDSDYAFLDAEDFDDNLSIVNRDRLVEFASDDKHSGILQGKPATRKRSFKSTPDEV